MLLAGSTGASQLVLAVLYVIAAREAGPALLGTVVVCVATATFAAGILDFGSNSLWVRETVSRRYTTKYLYDKILSKLSYTLLIAVVATAVSAVIFSSSTYTLLGALFFAVSFFQCSLVPLRVSGLGTQLSIAAMAERLIALAFFGVFLSVNMPAHIALIGCLCMGSTLAGLIAFAISPIKYRILRSFDFVLWPWKGTLSYGFGSLAISAQMLDAVILHSMAGPAAAGLYGAVSRWTQPLSVFAKAFSTVGLPVVIQAGSLRDSYRELRRSWQLLAVAAAICIVVAVTSPIIVHFILGPQYRDSSAVLAILAIGTIPALFNQPFLVFLQALRLEKSSAVTMLILVAAQLIACVYLSQRWAEVGAALAYAGFQYLLLFSFIVLLRRRRLPPAKPQLIDKPIGFSG